MEHPNKKNTFVFQAGILAAAGMLVKVIGLITEALCLLLSESRETGITMRRSISIQLYY